MSSNLRLGRDDAAGESGQQVMGDTPLERPELVIFDCDGVLVDSVAISCDVLAQSLSEAGVPTTPDEARGEYAELLLSDLVERAEAKLGRALPVNWLERYERDRARAFYRELRPLPGVAEVVARIRDAGVDVCVASQGKVEKTRSSLMLTGLGDLFSGGLLFSAYEVRRGKPHPDLFLHAARSMRARPSSCAVVEDMPSGVTAALSAGMRAFGLVGDGNGHEPALRQAGADILRSLEELPQRLGVAEQDL